MTAQAESGIFTHLDVPLANLRNILDKLIASDPLVPETWQVDFAPVTIVVKAHLILRSSDVDAVVTGWELFEKNNRIYYSDSPPDTYLIRHMMVEMQGWNRAKNSLANACANTFLSRTSRPYYHGRKSAYPIHSAGDKEISSRLKDIWVYFRQSSGSSNQSWGELLSQPYKNFSPERTLERYNSACKLDSGINKGEGRNILLKVFDPSRDATHKFMSHFQEKGQLGHGVKIEAPSSCTYGYNIKLLDDVYVGKDCANDDAGGVEVGPHTTIGPGVTILTTDYKKDM
ncbi:uncharacterized protein Z519_05497 [Cladophialophora bantiana CBS 173.52]|uniref:Uncharacterized protein n=1 Tax=Cladophialophora bantiana (strain ATCC 10958 / CBS 173.52 / CDC B-1940 / NIH 8579) TaxID=1442370 RepID=A0A0D2EWF4_CLAB1|nr:uncharacterized protein Z519_05497 [Cladophialophora bantiana CBS 173.52]KIW94181.1 hypothetical protein Z519_05497 [Cladophialophora bantiana CBS 173.52]